MTILVFNAGSSTLKYSLFAEAEVLAEGCVEVGTGGYRVAANRALKQVDKLVSGIGIEAVSHRVVHGGDTFGGPALIQPDVEALIERLCPLAPLHNSAALEVIRSAREYSGDIPQVAVFDTGYFANLPPEAYMYAVPFEWYSDWGLRRFGFHGISHHWCAKRAAALTEQPLRNLKIISLHLGSGCSAAAIGNGAPVATTMGYTPMDGLMMATRCGSIDPGVILHLLREEMLDLNELHTALNRYSGLLGVSGVSSDLRAVEAAMVDGNDRAKLAMRLFVRRIAEAVGALTVVLGGLDILVFTGGIGENSPMVRARICRRLVCLGCFLDPDLNTVAEADAEVTAPESDVCVLVIRAQEERQIAIDTARFLDTI